MALLKQKALSTPTRLVQLNAYGLMQVVPSTAGKDVYSLVKKRAGQPTKAVLFSPENNIDIGSAYLHHAYKRAIWLT